MEVFVSYRRLDSPRVAPVVDALRALGIKVWFDQTEISDFAPITEEIRNGLAKSKALLIWYSKNYPNSRPCQMELTAGWIAAQAIGQTTDRILIVNPEDGTDHIESSAFRDAQHIRVRSDDAPGPIAERVARHLIDRLAGAAPLGSIISALPPMYGHSLVAPAIFVGRDCEFWRLHSALHASEHICPVDFNVTWL